MRIIKNVDDYPSGCLLYCPYFKENYKIIAIDLKLKMAKITSKNFRCERRKIFKVCLAILQYYKKRKG